MTPDGERVLVRDAECKYFLSPLHGNGSPTPVSTLKTDDGVIALATDGHTVFAREAVQHAWTMRLVSIDLSTGKRRLLKEIEPPDRAGVPGLGPVQITPDGKTYVFGFTRRPSDLHVVEGAVLIHRYRDVYPKPILSVQDPHQSQSATSPSA